MTFGFARKFISRLESFLPIDPRFLYRRHLWSLIYVCMKFEVTTMLVSRAKRLGKGSGPRDYYAGGRFSIK